MYVILVYGVCRRLQLWNLALGGAVAGFREGQQQTFNELLLFLFAFCHGGTDGACSEISCHQVPIHIFQNLMRILQEGGEHDSEANT